MRLVFVSHSGELGGAELFLCELVRALQRTGVAELEVVLPWRGALLSRLQACGAATWVCRHWPWATLLRSKIPLAFATAANVAAAVRLAVHLKRRRADAVITNSVVNPAGAMAAWAVGIPHVWLVNEFGDLDHGYRFFLGVPRSLALVGRLSAVVVACSRAVADRLALFMASDKILVAYYPVTTALDLAPVPPPGRSGSPRFLVLGKRQEGKGQADAVRALALARRAGLDARLRLVGDEEPAYGVRLAALIHELELDSFVTLTGFTSRPSAEIDAADVVLMCSRAEGFGRVTVEAMKRRRAVIGARAGATTELLEASGGGKLYPVGDVRALADAMVTLGTDAGAARRLGELGAQWARENCNEERYLAGFLPLLRRVLAAASTT